jgi:hypothetical protein
LGGIDYLSDLNNSRSEYYPIYQKLHYEGLIVEIADYPNESLQMGFYELTEPTGVNIEKRVFEDRVVIPPGTNRTRDRV